MKQTALKCYSNCTSFNDFVLLQNGWTPLHFAAKAGHLKVVKLLVESGALPKNETKDSKVAVQFAAANSHAEVLSFLIRKEHDTHKLMDDKKVKIWS